MALLGARFNNGHIYGSFLLRGVRTYIEDAAVNKPFGIELQFFSQSGEYIGMVGTTFDDSNLINWELTEIGEEGVESFSFSIIIPSHK